jgi:diguanylate cyclase (GGDEF)-like protein/PAS domain S-box-containing protein
MKGLWCLLQAYVKTARSKFFYRSILGSKQESAIVDMCPFVEGSEQKSENDQMRRKQRDLEHAQQIAHIGNWEIDLSSREMTGSKEYYRIFGIDPETRLTEEIIRAAIHPDDVEAFYAEVLAAREVKRPFEFTGRILRPDGEPRHVMAQGIWLMKDADECTHVFGVVQDITEREKTEQELLQTRTTLYDTLDRLDIVLWARNFETKQLLFISEGTEKVFGISQEDACHMSSFYHIVHPDDRHIPQENFYSGNQHLLEYRIFHGQTREIRWIQTQLRPEEDKEGKVTAIHGISIDVTERKSAEAMIEAQNEVLGLIALGKPLSEILWKIAEQTNAKLPGRFCSIMLVNQDQRIFTNGASPGFPDSYIKAIESSPIDHANMYASRAVLSKKPVLIDDILGDPLWKHSQFKQSFEAHGIKSCGFFPVLSFDYKVIGMYSLFSQKSGNPKAYELKMIEAFVHLISLAIEKKDSERKIRKLAFYDSLTGLYNRAKFAELFHVFIKEAEQAQQKIALLYIDLDQFKWVNDSLGHAAGDQLLIEVANRMKRCLKEEQILARNGGDEFTILLRNVLSEEEALNAAKSVIASLQEPVSLFEHDVRITASMGISIYPDHGNTANVLMKQADTAMYQAKSKGRNNMKVYCPSYDDKKYDKFILQTQFHKALTENQFVLHYQPRIELKTGMVQSVEALIRWHHPVMGVIPPNDFISLAEESGFILPLGEWVMRKACSQNKEWQEEGIPPLRIAVNVSAQQFLQDSFVSRLSDILSETGIASELLEVEITESALMNHEEKIIAKLQELKQMGVHVSIDDFGTGYSSLNYLKSFEVTALKIDRSFLRDLFEDEKDAAITKMIISLAHNLQLEVIAEGVETEHQHEFLLHNGCEQAQGFLYCKPLSAKEMAQKLQSKLITLKTGD